MAFSGSSFVTQAVQNVVDFPDPDKSIIPRILLLISVDQIQWILECRLYYNYTKFIRSLQELPQIQRTVVDFYNMVLLESLKVRFGSFLKTSTVKF